MAELKDYILSKQTLLMK